MGSFAFAQSNRSLEDQILSGTYSGAPAPGAPQSAESSEPLPDPNAELKAKKSEVKSELEEVDESVNGPRSIPHDHILVVQYRFIRKEGMHEITPLYLGVQPGDSFRRQINWGFSYGYHITEDFGIEALNVSFLKNYSTGLADTIYSAVTRYTDRKEPVATVASSLLWTPLKSKAATFEDIHYFEGYFLAGGGMTKFEHRTVPMANIGLGFRAYLTQRSLFKVELRNSMDFLGGSPNQRLNILLGATVLLGEVSK